jgi:hypothetical protein
MDQMFCVTVSQMMSTTVLPGRAEEQTVYYLMLIVGWYLIYYMITV